MRYSSHKKTILLADSDLILKALQDEVVKYNDFDVELEQRSFRMGPKGHGKLIAKTQYIKKQGFEKRTLMSFMNDIRDEASKAGMDVTSYIRLHYKDYNFIFDEFHTLRRTSDTKSRYVDAITLLDAVRDTSPILLLTGTPIVDKWKDIFSIVGMMYPQAEREEIYRYVDRIPVYMSDTEMIDEVSTYLAKKAYGLFSSRRSSGVVPQEVPLATSGPTRYTVETDNSSIFLNENIYPVYMSEYQTYVTENPNERPEERV